MAIGPAQLEGTNTGCGRLPGNQLPGVFTCIALLKLLRIGRRADPWIGPPRRWKTQQTAIGAMGLLQKGHRSRLKSIGALNALELNLAALLAMQGQGAQRQAAQQQQR